MSGFIVFCCSNDLLAMSRLWEGLGVKESKKKGDLSELGEGQREQLATMYNTLSKAGCSTLSLTLPLPGLPVNYCGLPTQTILTNMAANWEQDLS